MPLTCADGCAEQDPSCLETIEVVATDLAECQPRASGAASPSTSGTPCVFRNHSAIGSASFLLAASEGLGEGRPGPEQLVVWSPPAQPEQHAFVAAPKESMRDVYMTEKVGGARTLLKKAIVGSNSDEVAEIRSLGDTLERWQSEILNHHRIGPPTVPTEGVNLCRKMKRAGHGFTSFKHYRLRVFLHASGVTWPRSPAPPTSEPAVPTSTRGTRLTLWRVGEGFTVPACLASTYLGTTFARSFPIMSSEADED